MKARVRIGLACLARDTFDFKAAKEIFDGKKSELLGMENVAWEIIPELVISTEEAQAAAQNLATKDLDGLVILSGTFHLGHLALIFDKVVNKPVLLWAFNELPYDGGKIRLNSVCGINLNASNLYKSGNTTFCSHISDDIDENWIDALRLKAAISRAHIGLAGYRAHGFFNLDVEDLTLFRRLGILIDHYELSDVYKNTAPAEELQDEAVQKDICTTYNCAGVSGQQVEKVAALAGAFKRFMDGNKLTALAVRCWPEFAADFGIAPCAAMSYLQSKGYILGCEGDVEGTVSMLACKAISDLAPFMADLSQVNFEEDYALMWHCGVASPSLWDEKSDLALDSYFAGGKGVTADFVLKSGMVTLFRIDTALGKTRVFLQRGKAVPMEKQLKGTYAKVVFEQSVRDLFQTVADNGIAHHVAMVYGDFTTVFRKFARLMGFEVIE